MNAIICLRDKTLNKEVVEKTKSIGKKRKIDIDIEEFSSADAFYFNIDDDPNSKDLVILDTDFFNEDGIKVAENLRAKGYENIIVFLTNDKSKVFESFEAEPLYYILTNEINGTKFEKAITKADAKIHEKRQEMLSFFCAGETCNVNLRNIYYFESDKRLLTVHYYVEDKKEREFTFYSPMAKMEELLTGKGFIRTHRGFLVALNKIELLDSSELKLVNGEKLPVGMVYYKKIRERLNAI